MLQRFKNWRSKNSQKSTGNMETSNADAYSSSSSLSTDFIPVSLSDYKNTTKHRLLKEEMVSDLRTLMPMRVKLYKTWTLLYSMEENGSSLSTLYRCCQKDYDEYRYKQQSFSRNGYLLIIQDMKDGIFGVYTDEPFHPLANNKFYGNGESFLWRIEESKNNKGTYTFEGFPFQDENFYVVYSDKNILRIGGGGSSNGGAGLWIDDMLLTGGTNTCKTFNNPVLSEQGTIFRIKALEVWKIG
ncbi:hypothetical protein FOG51_01341 [Hanseniaspora uvarum]|nr:hypothetical protein FOG51_01341 [Hanseniaspora uvarum]KAF0275511.1 hypothetical protein FOG50_03650 [Hanseniaspora uvarum]KKA02523.1 Oxidation resistance protein 1 [Hanseniaspora uvarum DSM 2768]GMM42636.1 Oxr1 protein [Hanseniaspora uvarum]